MTLATTRAAGFFRFPGRVTSRITPGASHVRRIERPGHPSARDIFRLRHVEIAAHPPASHAPHDATARITVRV